IRPLSWVMDSCGMYYDATAPSELEHTLQTTEFSADLLTRARRLRGRIVAEGLTKYNVGAGAWRRPKEALRVILVPGQVESDASIRYGGSSIRSNMELLQAVREAHPSAYVMYKPHPGGMAGLRTKGAGEGEALGWWGGGITDGPVGRLLA